MAILDKTLEIVNKFVPDKNAQAELFKNISCLRLSLFSLFLLKNYLKFKNISCLRLSSWLCFLAKYILI